MPTPEDQVRKTVDDLEAAIEQFLEIVTDLSAETAIQKIP
jgi:cell division septum initiation protein DivIVA